MVTRNILALQSQLFQLLKLTSEDLQLGSAVKATTKTIPNSLITTLQSVLHFKHFQGYCSLSNSDIFT